MFVNTDCKYSTHAMYFFNEYTEMCCVIGSTQAAEDLADLMERFASADLLEEVEMPDYITADYDGEEW